MNERNAGFDSAGICRNSSSLHRIQMPPNGDENNLDATDPAPKGRYEIV
jgi:hypothetical protein